MTTTPDPSIFRFFNEVGIIEQLAHARAERRLPYGLKLSQFSVLNHFVRLGSPSSPARLAKAFQVTKGAMTNTVSRLEKLGFVDVQPDPSDGRGKTVSITEAGIAAHGEAVAAMAPDFEALQNAFGSEVFAESLPFLERLRQHLDAHRD